MQLKAIELIDVEVTEGDEEKEDAVKTEDEEKGRPPISIHHTLIHHRTPFHQTARDSYKITTILQFLQ